MAPILLYLAIGLAVGALSGVLGIGGGIILIPLLMWWFGFDHRKAIGTTLGVMVPPIGLPAAVQYYSKDLLDVQAAIWIALGFAAGSYSGAYLAPFLPKDLLRIGFGLLLLYVGIRFVFALDQDARSAAIAMGLVGVALLVYLGLRALGRHYRLPNLGEEIRRLQTEAPPPPIEPDYHI